MPSTRRGCHGTRHFIFPDAWRASSDVKARHFLFCAEWWAEVDGARRERLCDSMKDFLKGLDCPYKDKFHTMKPFGEYVIDKASGRAVYHVRSLPLLIQAIGSVKYNLARIKESRTEEYRESGWRVYFRGQTSLMPNARVFTPSAYREQNGKTVKQEKADKKISAQIKILQENSENMKHLDKRVVEGVLQHYGLRSRWIDAVDNIWTALWFACHTQLSGNKNEECVHYVRRDLLCERAENKWLFGHKCGSLQAT